MLGLLLLLVGCTGKDEGPKDTGEVPLPPLAEPYVSLYANADPGTFRSDCLLEMDLKEGETVVTSADLYAIGGEWSGVSLPGTATYTAYASWSTCTTGPEGWGEEESSQFSGIAGNLFIFHYNGVLGAFAAVVQREDFDGGVVEATFAEDTTAEDVEGIATTYGLTATNVEGLTWRFTWDDETSVGEVLAQLSQERDYERGSPVWIKKPDWF